MNLPRAQSMKRVRQVVIVQLSTIAFLIAHASQPAAADTYHLPFLPSASDPSRQGLVRIVNHSAEAGEVAITAVDDDGVYYGPETVTVEALAAFHFSSANLEQGHEALGITGIGSGYGDWRLVLDSELQLEPLAYSQSYGFIDRLHDVAIRDSFYHRVTLPAPDGLFSDGGTLRLTNLAYTEAEVVIFGLDDSGTPSLRRPVVLKLPAGASRSISAAHLEGGALGLSGHLGTGEGDWRLLIFAPDEIRVMTLLESDSGALANLSTADAVDGEINLFPTSAEPSGRGVISIASRAFGGDVAIIAVDDAGQHFGPVTLSLEAERRVTLDANELEVGNGAKGLPTGLGRGQGNWRLRLESVLDLDIVSYARTEDELLAAVHDTASTSGQRHHVPWFFAADNERQLSRLRLINPGGDRAEIRIQAWDDFGNAAPNGAVRISVPAGWTRSVTALDLEQGSGQLDGSLGQGEGNWRLVVHADRDIRVMNLMESSEGHLTNLSTSSIEPRFLEACVGGAPDLDDDGIADYCDNEPRTALRPLGGCANGIYVGSPSVYPDLAADCRVLIGFANYLAQSDGLPSDHAVRLWGFGTQQRIDDWEGIAVSLFGQRVTAIDLAGTEDQPGSLSGFIPAQLGLLTELQRLELQHNRFVGSIPPELGDLIGLTRLELGRNRLSGEIPPELGNLFNLTGLFLYGNDLTGQIPADLGALVNLTTLSMGGNRLTGTIPAELGQLQRLVNLWLWGNDLHGPIPRELGGLSRLEQLQLQRNNLSGPLPTALGQLSQLEEMSLHDNRLSGSIPPEFGQLTNLRELWLRGNELTGPIPLELGRLLQLEELILHENSLSGEIPAELGQLTNLRKLWLRTNDLTGTIPAELGDLLQLEELSLSSNSLSGAIPRELGQLVNLTRLYLHRNELNGPIPPELGGLSQLIDLSLGDNRLSGAIPPELGQLDQLTELWLYRNQLSGEVPSSLGNLDRLEVLSVSNNRLTGTVPWALWDRFTRGDLRMYHSGNAIRGVGEPPARARPVFSGSAADNGNASHHSVALFQGPMTWEWNWEGAPVEHLRPLLGRWAVVAVRVNHEVETPPTVVARVLNSRDSVLVDRLGEAAPPSTVSTGEGQWRTEYVFDLPGEHYQAGNQLVHYIDPGNDLAELNENDNVSAPIGLYGVLTPPFRVTFVPMHVRGADPPSVDGKTLMAGTWAYLPIADDFQAAVRSPVASGAADKFELLDEIRALWNAEADANEYYHGVFRSTWPGAGDWADRVGGVSSLAGQVAVSEISPHFVIPHELGHNLSLQHPAGCGAGNVDEHFPYAGGGLGPRPGWDVNWRRFVSEYDEGYLDLMSYCRESSFISDYHYRKATDYRLRTASATRSSMGQSLAQTGGLSPNGAGVSGSAPPIVVSQANADPARGGLALSGRIDRFGAWRLTHAQLTERGQRPPGLDGAFTIVLLDINGTELYREPLTPISLSDGGEAGWASRMPVPPRPARQVVILDPQGETVLQDELPLLE